MSEAREYNVLRWIKAELDSTINDARHTLEQVVDGDADHGAMGVCAERLHQVGGTLQMVQLYGAAMLAEEMELAARAMEAGQVAKPDEAAETLMLGLVKLPDYLEQIQAGAADVPLALLPLMNDLRAVRDAPLLSETSLFGAELDKLLHEPEVQGEPNPELPELARRMRHHYHLGLIKVFRGEDDGDGLRWIEGVVRELEDAAGTTTVSRLFTAAAGLLAAAETGAVETGTAVKRLLGQLDREIKRVIDKGEEATASAPATELFKSLLYYVAEARTDDPRVRKVKDRFELDRFWSGSSMPSLASGELSALNDELLETVREAIAQDITHIKDGLDLFIRGGSADLDRLSALAAPIGKVADTLGMVGQGGLRVRLRQLADRVVAAAAQGREPSESDLMDMAGEILFVESSLSNLGTPDPGMGSDGAPAVPDGEYRTLLRTTLHEAGSELGKAKEAVSSFLERPDDFELVAGVPARFRATAGALKMINLPEAAGMMDAVAGYFERDVLGGNPPSAEAQAALADVVTSVEFFMDAVSHDEGGGEAILEIAREGLGRLGLHVGRPGVASAAADDPEAEVVDAGVRDLVVTAVESEPDEPEAWVEAADVAAADGGEAAQARAEDDDEEWGFEEEWTLQEDEDETPRAGPSVVDQGSLEAVDTEILDIFLEEARDELAVIGKQMPRWRSDPSDTEALTTFRRSFHTLKGSGRLVGASDIGEYAWSVENLLNRIIEGSVQPTGDIQSVLDQSLEILPRLIRSQETGEPHGVDIGALMGTAFDMAGGKPAGPSAPPRTVQHPGPEEDAEPEQAPAGTASAEIIELYAGVDPAEGEDAADRPEVSAQPAPITLDPTLAEIFETESRTHLDAINRFLQVARDAHVAPELDDSVCRALHTLHGSAHMAEVGPVADLSAALERYANELRALERRADDDFVELLERSTDAIQALVGVINVAGAQIPAWRPLLEDVERARDVLEHPAPGEGGVGVYVEEDTQLTATESPDAESEVAEVDGSSDREDWTGWEADAGEPPAGIEVFAVTTEPGDFAVPAAEERAGDAAPDAEADSRPGEPADAGIAGAGEAPADGEASARVERGGEDAWPSSDPEDGIGAGEAVPQEREGLDQASLDTAAGAGGEVEGLGADAGAPDAEVADADGDEPAEPQALESLDWPAAGETADLEIGDADDPGWVSVESGEEPRVPGGGAPEDPVAGSPDEPSEGAEPVESPEWTAGAEAPDDVDPDWGAVASDEGAQYEEAPSTVEAGGAEAEAAEPTEDAFPEGGIAVETDEDLLEIFLEEARELVEGMDRAMQEWTAAPESKAPLAGLERTLHTLKGGARLAGIAPVGDLSHSFESLLSSVEQDRVSVDEYLIELAQRVADTLVNQIDEVSGIRRVHPADDLLEELETAISGRPAPAAAVEASEAAGEEAGPAPAEEAPSAQAEADARVLQFPKRAGEASGEDRATVHAATEARGRPTGLPRSKQEQVRVRAELLDRLVNNAGEVSIYRARLEQQSGALGFNLTELDQTVRRLRQQLRQLEIETEAQILFRYERDQEEAGVEYDLDFDPLEMDRFSTIQQLSRSLAETVNDLVSIRDIMDDLNRETETLLLQQSRITTDLQDGLLRTRMVPFSTLVPRMHRLVRQTGSQIGRRAQLEVFGADSEMDRSILERMVAPLEHILRNAVSHGIEPPEVRRAEGKDETGRISMYLFREANDVVLTVSDDGGGLRMDAIRTKAIEKGLLAEGASISDDDLIQFIMEHGFSTSDVVTQISGRGVGMDVVVSEVKQLGGAVEVDSQQGRGSSFTVRLPLTLAISDALLVELAEEVYAVPHTSIEGVVRISRQDIEDCYARRREGIDYAGHQYAVRYLGSILGTSTVMLAEQAKWFPLLLVRAGEHRVALQVDALAGNRQIVVKSVGPQLSSVRWITGGTILADGRVALILDVNALIRIAAVQELAAPEQPTAEELGQGITVMVVDDSITVRKVTSRLLERHNMNVLTAKDGVDAVAKLQEQVPDVMLLDIEMPRMDGYELARHMRNSPDLTQVPIIMITSRTGEKHRTRAFELGVNRYLGKPYQETDLMENIYSLLAERQS